MTASAHNGLSALRRVVLLRHCGTLLLFLAMSGCATITRHGDARLRDNPNFLFVVMDELVFPKVSLARTATYRFRVRDLPQVIYPSGFSLEVPADEAAFPRHDQPWRGCKIRASLVTPDGVVFFTRTIDLAKDWNGNSSDGRNAKSRSLVLFFAEHRPPAEPHLPAHLSYDLTIQILQPSSRSTDALRIDAPTLL